MWDLRIELDLIANWLNLAVCKKIPNELSIEVGNTNALCQALLNECFHLWPEYMKWLLSVVHHGPVDKIQVDLIKLKLGKRVLECGLWVVPFVVPQLSCDIDISSCLTLSKALS